VLLWNWHKGTRIYIVLASISWS